MAGNRFRFSFIVSLAVAAIAWVTAVPGRALIAARDFFADALAYQPRPLNVNDGPTLALSLPGGPGVSPSLYQRNRHEAGLARLGAVRHR